MGILGWFLQQVRVEDISLPEHPFPMWMAFIPGAEAFALLYSNPAAKGMGPGPPYLGRPLLTSEAVLHRASHKNKGKRLMFNILFFQG